MKRIFIAIGSTGTRALAALIERLDDQGLLYNFSDKYIAIDSCKEEVDRFQELRVKYHIDRIFGIKQEIKDDDRKIRDYQPEWHFDIDILYHGTNRAISSAAFSFFKDIWHNPDLLFDLKPDDEIIIMGSAFGSTSSGLFLNICEFLDLQIRKMCIINEEYRNVCVLGFLLMPEVVIEENRHYPIFRNIIDLFRDLQTISWQRRLESCRKGFKVPLWAQQEGNYYPLNDKNDMFETGIYGSSLPISNFYIVPTPKNRREISISQFSEQVFAVTYLGLKLDPSYSDFQIRDFLNKIFDDEIIRKIIFSCDLSTISRLIMTTLDMVRFGLVIEAIEDAVQRKWQQLLENNNGLPIINCKYKFQLTFKGSGNSFSLPCDNLGLSNSDLFRYNGDNTFLQMEKISDTWVREIFKWIRDNSDNGFEKMLGMEEAKFTSIKVAQIDIVNSIRFHITQKEMEAMDKVKEKLVSMLEVSILDFT